MSSSSNVSNKPPITSEVPIKPNSTDITGVSLFPYGPRVGDREFVKRTVDFTSPLFKPQIGFPLGSSLRDYLYFTDNGQIIFPESEYQIFSYPNPPARGFTGLDSVALVAPFWDDADFSSGQGTIFYQEYETLYDEHNQLLWQVESWIKKFTYTWSYKARWTLKVTWVDAPAYPARWTFGTNTYQVILSTDGSRSYALFLYQSGGMQWDVTQRPGNPVLMGFSSGDGHFENSPLTSQPMWQKYLPDQFLNSNSDQELEPQSWCCRWNDQPSFCALYQQRQPRIGCAGYRPPRPAWMFGDPHITTLDGASFTFNGLGDFQLVRAWDGNSSFLLQGRTAQTGSAQATNFIAFAAKYDTSRLSPITVRWLLEPNDTIHVQVNNQTVTFETNREDPEGLEIFNTTGIIMTRNGSLVSATFDGTVTISVTALTNILHTSCSLPEEYRNCTEGLLGVWNDNPDDDFRMPNGSTIPSNSTEETLFQYGMTWEINGTKLLGKRDDHLPSNFTPIFLSQLQKNTSDEKLVAECNGDKQCIYDSLATRNTGIGLSTKMLFRRHQQMNATLNKYPPSIDGQRVLEAYVGQTKRIQYTSHSAKVTFTLRNNGTDFRLFARETSPLCRNQSCPVNYCYNRGHCSISQALGCRPACTCPPAFTDTRCIVAGNNFTPTVRQELPLRVIQLWLSEEENASATDVNASLVIHPDSVARGGRSLLPRRRLGVAYRLRNLSVRAFLRNRLVAPSESGTALASGSLLRRWKVISEFQYLPWGPVIDFLNTELLDAVLEAFLPQSSWRQWSRSEGPRTNVNFHPISREDVDSLLALNVSTLKNYFICSGYKDYHLVYSPQSGLTCVSPCSEGYCEHGGQCQHWPQGPRCTCVPFSIYTPWGERCEHLGMKLGAFFGILFGALGFLLLLGAVVFVVLRFGCYRGNHYSYPLDSES
ncbi:hypothetical protein GH733_002948 [Mirounga leonina]|nr:hypothetical protein GH733_002948 [Mirounga leonina]